MKFKKVTYYILAAFLLATIILVYIQYNSSKNVSALILGNEKYLDEYNIDAKLKTLERDVASIESNVSDVISTNDSEYIKDIDKKIEKVETDVRFLQTISDDAQTVKEIDQLDTVVQNKLLFSRLLLDSFYSKGKVSAEKMIGTLRGKMLMDSIYLVAGNIENSRHIIVANITASNNKNGASAQRFNTILIVLVLFAGAALFWYIINIIRKLILSEKKLKVSAQVKENFMTNMSHEIRTPMNAILGFTNLLQRKKLDDESKEYVQTIQKSGESLLTIINDILDLSKIEAGMMRIETAAFSIRGLVHSVEVMFREKAAEKKIKLTTEVDDSLPDTLAGDATRLTQILINLIGNALKFTQAGSVSIKIINEGANDETVDTGILITDTGIGIEPEKINSIFDRFQQAENSITRKFGGTGLGLSIVKDLVLLQHGNIRLESQPGIGTTFHINIPYKIATHAPRKNYLNVLDEVIEDDFAAVNILVVEDNEINQSLVNHLFKSWNLSFMIVNNGREAIEELEQDSTKYNLVLMDIQMPEMDGYTATQHIRYALKLNIPIIAMTAHALAGEREKCISYGMNDYISKPIREEQLHQLIRHFLRDNTIAHLLKKNKAINKCKYYEYINLDYMKEISGGNSDYEKLVTEQFIELVPEEIKELEASWKNNDFNGLKQLAHNMKTTVSIMGLNKKLQPYLDAIEYRNLNETEFEEQFVAIKSICTASLAEARKFYATF